MSFQFRCPQGHVLQGDHSQVGQLCQCPMCGSSFLIPPPTMDPGTMGGPVAPAGYFPAPWPAAPGPSFPTQGPMPGMMPPQTMPRPGVPGAPPGSPMPAGPMSVGPYSMPAGQPFAFGPAVVNPPAPGPTPAPAAPTETPQQAPATAPQNETGKPGFDLGFDPNAKASLPFEIPGQSDAESGSAPAAPLPAPSFPAPSFPASSFPAPSFPGSPFPATDFPAPTTPAPTFEPSAGGQDLSPSVPTATEEEAAPQNPPKVLHIRCPSGHLVKAKSDLLGQNGRCPACKKTFELRYEDSIEFLRRKEKILHREEIKTGRAWLAWAFLATFVVFAGLVALMLALSR